MKIVVTGSLGNIGKPLTQELVQRGHNVTVVSSTPERKSGIEALGAKAAIGTIQDSGFLSTTFRGADAVFLLISPAGAFTDTQLDVDKMFRETAEACISAIKASGLKRLVYLSSIGADLESGTGLLRLHHATEALLSTLNQVSITFIRPSGFYTNLFRFIPIIKARGIIAADYGEADILQWVSGVDIATAVAEELELLASDGAVAAARKIRYVASDELTGTETARVLGEAIGKPDLKWVIVPGQQVKEGMVAAGINPSIADDLVEMNATLRSGRLAEDYYHNRPVLGRVKIADFAKEFAAAYQRT